MSKGIGTFSTILQYLIRILLFEISLAIIVVALLYIVERKLDAFGDWMFSAGLIFLALSLIGFLGNLGITRSGLYQLGQSVSGESASDRLRTELREEQNSFSLVPVALGVAILAMVIGGIFSGGS